LNATAEVYVEGRKRKDPEPQPRFEIRIDGPQFDEVSNKCWFLTVEINILIVTSRDERDTYNHQKVVGECVAAFTDDILVKKYGSEDGDDESLIGCFTERSDPKEKVVVSNFGVIEPTNRLIMSTAEGHYQMCLKEG
jgi:hypothetical protein